MNVKNLNPLERHVEKIVLAVAAAGAIFIGYLALKPITIPDTDVKAADVEPKVTEAVTELDDKRAAVLKLGDLTPAIKRYDQEYIRTVNGEPVPQILVAQAVPQFAPKNLSVERFSILPSGVNNAYQVLTPTVPAPTDVTSTGDLFVVNDLPQLDSTGNPVPVANPTTHNATMVVVSGFIPMSAFLSQMNDKSLKPNQVLPPDQQRGVVYRIEVQRRELVNGSWSSFVPVTPSKAGGDLPQADFDSLTDATLPTTFNDIDALFKRIVEPDYYTLPNGESLNINILSKIKSLAPVAPSPDGSVAPTPTRTPAAGGNSELNPQAAAVEAGQTPQPQPTNPGAAAAASPSGSLLPDPTTMHALPKIPFWFFDETATGGHTYQYQVRIVMLNPTFHSLYGLQNPAMAKTPLLFSPWTVVASPFEVPSQEHFFITNVLGNKNGQVGVKLFKWVNGYWCVGNNTVQVGGPISGRAEVTNAAAQTSPEVVNGHIDVKTGYTLVDVSTTGDIEATLLNPEGELVRRSAKADAATGLYDKLTKATQHVMLPPPPPTTQPVPGSTTVTPIPPPPPPAPVRPSY